LSSASPIKTDNSEKTHLFDDVLEDVLEPVVEGDVALAVLVDGREVLLALGDAGLFD
jgi:hypothetical protein